MIAIVDYGVGNLFSLRSSLLALGQPAEVTGDSGVIRSADRVILPGVGAFGDAADKLRASGLDRAVCEAADRNRVEAINFLESQCGEDRGAFINKLAGIVESASGSERDYALRGLETYANIVLPAKE